MKVGYGGRYPNAGGLVPFKGEEYSGDHQRKKKKKESQTLLYVLYFFSLPPADTHVRNIRSNPDRVWVMEEGKEAKT